MAKHIAIYVRVSTKQQETKSQERELKAWAEQQDEPVKWYRDKATGKNMDRPGWNELMAKMRRGSIIKIVVWRLDRLGRTVSGLSQLFDHLRERKVGLVSLKDGVDLTTPAGRLIANVLASVAAYETEVRGERVAAGQAVAKANGKSWGGSLPGVHKKLTPTQLRAIRRMKLEGEKITHIAKAVGVTRQTIYNVLAIPEREPEVV